MRFLYWLTTLPTNTKERQFQQAPSLVWWCLSIAFFISKPITHQNIRLCTITLDHYFTIIHNRTVQPSVTNYFNAPISNIHFFLRIWNSSFSTNIKLFPAFHNHRNNYYPPISNSWTPLGPNKLSYPQIIPSTGFSHQRGIAPLLNEMRQRVGQGRYNARHSPGHTWPPPLPKIRGCDASCITPSKTILQVAYSLLQKRNRAYTLVKEVVLPLNIREPVRSVSVEWHMFIKNKRCILTYLAVLLNGIYQSFLYAKLPVIVKGEFGINEKCAGYLLIGQVVSSGIANIIQKKESPKESRIYMSLSFMINFIGCIWIGPSWILQIPQYESLFLAGILLLGLGQIPILAYSQIEIVKAVHMQTGINLEEVPLSTYARSFISISQTIGFIIGPLIGISGGLPLICDSLALVSLLFGFLYFMLSVLYFSDSEGFGVNSSYYCTLSQNDQLRPDEEKALKELPLGQEIENTSERAKECVLVRRSSWDGVKASTPLPVEVSQSRNDSTSSAGEDELHFEENNKKLVFISALKADKNSSTVVIRNRIQSMDANVPRQDKVDPKLFKQYSRSKVEDLFNKVRE